jgi:sulfide dehydrogenase cytochrome subunit
VTAQHRRIANGPSVRQIIALSIAASLVIPLADRGIAAGNDRGAPLAAMCASCHRLDGRDKGVPSIVALDKANLAGAMAAFKSAAHSSQSQIMHVVALSLSDGEIATLAAYLAALPKETKRP